VGAVKPFKSDGTTVDKSKNKMMRSSQIVNELEKNDSVCKMSGRGMYLRVLKDNDGQAETMKTSEDTRDAPNMTQWSASIPSR
jgi:hypothetical protein